MKKSYKKYISFVLAFCLLLTAGLYWTNASVDNATSSVINALRLKVNGTNSYASWVCLTLPIEAEESVEFSFDMKVTEGVNPNFYYRQGTEYKLITPSAREGYRYFFKLTGSDKNSQGQYNNFTRFCFDFGYIKSDVLVSGLELYKTDANYENKDNTNLVNGVFGATGKFDGWSINKNYTDVFSKAGQISFMASLNMKPFNHELFQGSNLVTVTEDVFDWSADAIKFNTQKDTEVILPLNCLRGEYYELSFNLKSDSDSQIKYSVKNGDSYSDIPYIKINDRYYFRFKAFENVQSFKMVLPANNSTLFTGIKLYKADGAKYSNIDSNLNLAVGEKGFSSDENFKNWNNISSDFQNIIPGQIVCNSDSIDGFKNIVPVDGDTFSKENILLNWSEPGKTATLTIINDNDEAIAHNSLVVRRAKEGKEILPLKRVGFQTENMESDRYTFEMTEADSVISTMPFNGLEISVDYIKNGNLDIDKIGWQLQTDDSGNVNGLAFGTKIGFDVVNNQIVKDEKTFEIKEKGTIFTRLETLQSLNKKVNLSEEELLKFNNRSLWAKNGISDYFVVIKQNKVYDKSSQYIDIFGGIDGLTVNDYDVPFVARGYVIIESMSNNEEEILYTDISASSVNSILNNEQIGGAYKETAELKNNILNAADKQFATTNKIYYVSENGSGDGLSESKPCSLNTFKNKSLTSGDIVLFERGSTFRLSETLQLKSGVSYAAYGSGEKPVFTGSAKNYKNSSYWQLYDTEKNIYKLTYWSTNDIGIVLIDDGKIDVRKRFSLDMLHDNGDFYHDTTKRALYLRYDNFDECSSIEIGERRSLFSGGVNSNINIDNLNFKCTGGHGVDFCIAKNSAVNTVENIKISNCAFSFIGGSVLDADSSQQLYGNAVQFYTNLTDATFKNIEVSDSYMTQIYDAGFTFQAQCKANFENISFIGNLVEKTTMPIEWWGREDSNINNIDFSDNIFSFTGYGWGRKRGDRGRDAHITSGQGIWNYNLSDFNIKNNIFDCSYTLIISHLWENTVNAELNFSENTYYQKDRMGKNDLGYGKGLNGSIKYGAILKSSSDLSVAKIDASYGVSYYSSNQKELEEAVKIIEAVPNKVKWITY